MPRRNLKQEALLAKYFRDEVKKTLANMGIAPSAEEIGPDGEERLEYAVLTDGGRYDMTLHDDDLFGRFDRPKLGQKVADCNPHSGKKNHHCFIGQAGHSTKEAVDAVLMTIGMFLGRVDARPWETRRVPISVQNIARAGIESIKDRAAMGDDFIVVGFDRAAFIAELRNDMEDDKHPKHRSSNEYYIRRAEAVTDLEAYIMSCSYQVYRQQQLKADAEKPALAAESGMVP